MTRQALLEASRARKSEDAILREHAETIMQLCDAAARLKAIAKRKVRACGHLPGPQCAEKTDGWEGKEPPPLPSESMRVGELSSAAADLSALIARSRPHVIALASIAASFSSEAS